MKKFRVFSSCPTSRMKAIFKCQLDLASVVVDFEILYGSLIHTRTFGFQEIRVYFATLHKFSPLPVVLEMLENGM